MSACLSVLWSCVVVVSLERTCFLQTGTLRAIHSVRHHADFSSLYAVVLLVMAHSGVWDNLSSLCSEKATGRNFTRWRTLASVPGLRILVGPNSTLPYFGTQPHHRIQKMPSTLQDYFSCPGAQANLTLQEYFSCPGQHSGTCE